MATNTPLVGGRLVALPGSLTVAEANRLAQTLRPSWDEQFRSGGDASVQNAAPAAAVAPAPLAAGASHAPLVSPEVRPLTPDRVDDIDDASSIVVPTSGLPWLKVGIGVAAAAVLAIGTFIATRPSEAPKRNAAAGVSPAPAVASEIAPPAPPTVPQSVPEPPAAAEAPTASAEPEPPATPTTTSRGGGPMTPHTTATPTPAAAGRPAPPPRVPRPPPPAAAPPANVKAKPGKKDAPPPPPTPAAKPKSGGIVREVPF